MIKLGSLDEALLKSDHMLQIVPLQLDTCQVFVLIFSGSEKTSEETSGKSDETLSGSDDVSPAGQSGRGGEGFNVIL